MSEHQRKGSGIKTFIRDNHRMLTYFSLIAAAYLLRIPYAFGLSSSPIPGILRTILHIALFALWSNDLKGRIIQPQIIRSLLFISGLMMAWTFIKGLKYYIFVSPAADRYLWYLYYAPMLLIPAVGLMSAFLINRPSSYRLPAKVRVLVFPSVLLFLLVITNDFHQLVFRFPGDISTWSDNDYRYGSCYIIVACWSILCGLMFIVISAVRAGASMPRAYFIKPLAPLLAIIALLPLYLTNNNILVKLAGDFSTTYCIIVIAVIEACISCRFIPSNMLYGELFEASLGISARITDNDYNIVLSAHDADSLPRHLMSEAESGPVMVNGSTRVINMPVHGGHMIWQEDFSELYEAKDRLSDTVFELEERNEFLHLEYEREKEAALVREQNRLYSLLENSVRTRLDTINSLVEKFPESDPAKRKQILARIILIGTYVKRRKDLILQSYSSDSFPSSALYLSVNESTRALERLGIKGTFFFLPGSDVLSSDMVLTAYDFIFDVIEASLEHALFFNIRMSPLGGSMRINILTDVEPNLMKHVMESLSERYPDMYLDEDEDENLSAVILQLCAREVSL